jgi:hypothetical protein
LELVIVTGEDSVFLFDEGDLHRNAVFGAVGGDLAGGLDARQAAPADDHLCRLRLGGLLGGRPDLLVDRHRVLQALERERVFFEAVDAEKRRPRAETHDDEIVVDRRSVGEFHRPRIDVETGDLSLNERGVGRPDLLDRYRDLIANVGTSQS